MKTLITGKTGQLGRALCDHLRAGHAVTATDRKDPDIRDEKAVNNLISTLRREVNLDAATYTTVDLAETETSDCWAVNAEGPVHLTRTAAQRWAKLIHVSTDYVF